MFMNTNNTHTRFLWIESLLNRTPRPLNSIIFLIILNKIGFFSPQIYFASTYNKNKLILKLFLSVDLRFITILNSLSPCPHVRGYFDHSIFFYVVWPFVHKERGF